MHSGTILDLLAPVKMVPARSAKKILDGDRQLCSNAVMEKFIRHVQKSKGHFGVNIPRKIILGKCWGDVSHVLIEDSGKDTITIRRLLDGKSLKE